METIVWKIKGDIYERYILITSFLFDFAPQELMLATELFREYNRYLSESTPAIAWELINTSSSSKRIREKLGISAAHFTNLKNKLREKKFISYTGFHPKIKISNLLIEFHET